MMSIFARHWYGTLILPLLTLATLGLVGCLIAISYQKWKTNSSQQSWLGTHCLFLVVTLGIGGWVLFCYPARHRIYYDEDVYANIAFNISQGHGGNVTQVSTAHQKVVTPFKWPLEFPLLAAGFVAMFGCETGPVLLNGLCGLLTLYLLMLATRKLTGSCYAALTAGCLYGLHPVVGGWYRSGSSEPLSILFIMLMYWACLESHDKQNLVSLRSMGLAAALLSGLLAVHTRLENGLLIVPALLLLWRIKFTLPRLVAVFIFLIAVALMCLMSLHWVLLKDYYLTNLPQSTFSTDFVGPNFPRNVSFLVQHTPWPLALASVVLVLLVWKRHASAQLDLPAVYLLAWSLFALLHFLLLLLYSVGQYDAPGGSRFFLIQALCLAALVPLLLASLSKPMYGMLGVVILLLIAGPTPNETSSQLHAPYESAEQEYQAIQKWAKELPSDGVVLSRTVSVWEAAGVLAVHPDYEDLLANEPDLRLYQHVGLFDLAIPDSTAPFGMLIQSVNTKHGAVRLYRLP